MQIFGEKMPQQGDKLTKIVEKMHKIGIFVKYNLQILEISINFAVNLHLIVRNTRT